MIQASRLVAVLLFASASIAYAADSTQPAATGAASVDKNLTANKSDGHADKGLTTAEKHITAKHGKADKADGKMEKVEHVAKVERPAMPERPGR